MLGYVIIKHARLSLYFSAIMLKSSFSIRAIISPIYFFLTASGLISITEGLGKWFLVIAAALLTIIGILEIYQK